MEQSFISTTQLAKEMDIETSELFSILNLNEWINRKNDKWMLTPKGEKNGGKIINHEKYGEFIGWDNKSVNEIIKLFKDFNKSLLTAKSIATKYNTTAQKINLILSEIGWIQQDTGGWIITKLGKIAGGVQQEHFETGKPYVSWPELIFQNKEFIESLIQNNIINEKIQEYTPETFRTKYQATMRAQDGHFVRSRAELLIDNYLYQNGLLHAYERKLPIEEEVYCDFYLPSTKVYIEFWGLENDPSYLERKKKKLEIYRREEINLIELNDNDINNLDDILPKKLRKFGISVN